MPIGKILMVQAGVKGALFFYYDIVGRLEQRQVAEGSTEMNVDSDSMEMNSKLDIGYVTSFLHSYTPAVVDKTNSSASCTT
jgi:hypothetical protein